MAKKNNKIDGWLVGWIEKYMKKMDGWMDKKEMDGWMDRKKRKKRWMVGWIKKYMKNIWMVGRIKK